MHGDRPVCVEVVSFYLFQPQRQPWLSPAFCILPSAVRRWGRPSKSQPAFPTYQVQLAHTHTPAQGWTPSTRNVVRARTIEERKAEQRNVTYNLSNHLCIIVWYIVLLTTKQFDAISLGLSIRGLEIYVRLSFVR